MSSTEKTGVKKNGRPRKNPILTKEEQLAKQRDYMKEYHVKNKQSQLARRKTSYYVNKYNLSKEYAKKYGVYMCEIYKCQEAIRKIEKECPNFLTDIKGFLDNIVNKNNDKVADDNKVLTETK